MKTHYHRRLGLKLAAMAGIASLASLGQPVLAQATTPAPQATSTEAAVSSDATAALDQMGVFLRSLQKFTLRVDAHRELVTDDGQKIQIHTVSAYKASLPDKLAVETRNIFSHEVALFDGKKLVFVLPDSRLYAEADFTGSVDQMLQTMYTQYGLEFPVQDMFRWGTDASSLSKPRQAIVVGPDLVDGWLTTQYAVRLDKVDFQIWLDQGERRIPRRLVITDLSDPTHPEYSADFTWDLTSPITDAMFTFPDQPGEGATPPTRVPMEQATQGSKSLAANITGGRAAR